VRETRGYRKFKKSVYICVIMKTVLHITPQPIEGKAFNKAAVSGVTDNDQ
jgi:hypothetical protein